jgi:hypothetical protein
MIRGIMRDDTGLECEIEIDEIEYQITYSVWKWESPDGTEQDEFEVSVTNTIPYLEDDSDEMKEIQAELEEGEK